MKYLAYENHAKEKPVIVSAYKAFVSALIR